MREVELLVIGGGPAGCAAATAAARLGVETLLVDENPLDPAYLIRNVPRWYGSRLPIGGTMSQMVYRWLAARPELQQAAEAGAEVLIRHAVWGLFPGRMVGLYDGARTSLLRARQVILATGATDLHLAFPGWTLSGVIGGSGFLHLLDLYGRFDARRMLVLGSGNLALKAAARALTMGINVVGLVEIEKRPRGDPAAISALVARGVPLFMEHTIKEARGGTDVEEVVLAQVGGSDAIGPETVIDADALCVAIGAQPAIELPYLAGCALTFDAMHGGFLPRHDIQGRTSVEGILVAGDLAGTTDTGIYDYRRAEQSGRRAALAAAAALCRREAAADDCQVKGDPAASYSEITDAYISRWHRVADANATDDLIVCRCEEVTRGAVLAACALVGSDPNEVKRVSRAGMGFCQGRGCRPILTGLLAARIGHRFAALPLPTYRPPVRALPLTALATEEARMAPPVPAIDALGERLAHDVAAGRLAPTALSRFHARAEDLRFAYAALGDDEAGVKRLVATIERQLRASTEWTAGNAMEG